MWTERCKKVDGWIDILLEKRHRGRRTLALVPTAIGFELAQLPVFRPVKFCSHFNDEAENITLSCSDRSICPPRVGRGSLTSSSLKTSPACSLGANLPAATSVSSSHVAPSHITRWSDLLDGRILTHAAWRAALRSCNAP